MENETRSAAMRRCLERVDAVAPYDTPVLITGPSGAGKELIARRIAARSGRGAGPFIDELAAVHTLPLELRPTLGAALQRAHGALDAPLQGGPPSVDETLRFAEALGRVFQAEPSLAAHLGPLAAAR